MLPEFYNQLGAMHGTIMVFLGVVPLVVGAFGNYFRRQPSRVVKGVQGRYEMGSGSVERRPAAVIMDLSSPDCELTGEELATKVRDALGEVVPLVLISNRSDIEARLDAVRAGCSSYFVKPVNYSDFGPWFCLKMG